MAIQNVKDFNTTNLLNLQNDSILSIQNNELVRLNGSNTIISGVNQISTNLLNVTGSLSTVSLSTINRPTVNTTGVMLVGEASQTETALFTWIPGADQNLGLATDFYPPFSNVVYNSNTNIFELVNVASSSPVARVFVKQAGYYQLGFKYFGFDLKTQNRVTFKLFTSATSNGAFTFVRWLAKNRHSGLDSDGDSMESWINLYISAPGYYTCVMFSQDLNPYTLRSISISSDIPTFSMYWTRLRG